MSKSLVQKQFGANASKYATSPVHAKGASLARLVELVQPQPDWEALDVASAAGHTAFVFAPHVAHVVSSDLTPEMLPVAAKGAAEKGLNNLSFQEADAEALPFEDGRFDLVTCRIAPHHFPHVDRFLAESVRVLKPGGTLAVVDNVAPDKLGKAATSDANQDQLSEAGILYNHFEKLRDPSHGRCLTTQEWLDGFEAVGLEVLHYEHAPKTMAFEPWADRMQVSVEDKATLRAMLTDGAQGFRDFVQPAERDGDIFFTLAEAIVVGQKG